MTLAQRWTRSLLAGLIPSFILSLAFSASAAASSITFKVTLPANQQQPIMGRLFVIIARAR